MDDELLKRNNTDCVYFLASPLTCKKGIECEYRHSEVARLNPRDCWYWLSGNCLNPSCGFRHPPLDGPAEAPSEFALLPYQGSVPVDKTNVPCYFYFNGFCNKGDRCSFLHGPDGNTPTKSLKTASATTEVLTVENKTCVGNERGSTPAEIHVKPLHLSETTTKAEVEVGCQAKKDLQQPAPRIFPQRSASPEISVFECEAALVRSDSLVPAEGSVHSRSDLLSDQSSEEQVDDDRIEPEERLDSSPGFDVLVDDKSENLGYDDDPEYLLAPEQRELNNHFLGYDYEDPDEYNRSYHDTELLHDREIYDCYDHLDNEHIFDNVRRFPGHSRERILDSLLPRKRKPLPMELTFDDRNDLDLRDHLLKRRVIDGHPVTRSSRRHESSCLIVRGPERPRRHGMGRRLRGRLTSEMGKNTVDSFRDYGTLSNGAIPHGKHRLPLVNRSRQRYKEKRPVKREVLSSEVSRKPASRERRFMQESSTFSGPKTLAQIKEEKRKVEGNEDCFVRKGHSSRTSSANFQGPKPLSEILQEKKRDCSARDGNSSSS